MNEEDQRSAPQDTTLAKVLSLAEHKDRLAKERAERLYPDYNPYRLFDWYGFPKPGTGDDEDDYDDY